MRAACEGRPLLLLSKNRGEMWQKWAWKMKKWTFLHFFEKKSRKCLHGSEKVPTFASLLKRNTPTEHWKGGRVVDYSGLENRRAERHRGFESLPFRRWRATKVARLFLFIFFTQFFFSLTRTLLVTLISLIVNSCGLYFSLSPFVFSTTMIKKARGCLAL